MNTLLTAETVAEILGVKPKTVRDMGRTRMLKRVVVSPRVVRFAQEDVAAFIAAKTQNN